MIIILSPVASDHTTQVSISGLVLNVDGTTIDLSLIPEGGQAEAADGPLLGVVTRDRVMVKYHYESAKAVPHQSTNWADYTFDITEGEVPCPIVWKPEPEVIEESDLPAEEPTDV